MIKFDEKKYLDIGRNTMKLKGRIDEITEAISKRGYKNIFLIGSGGSNAMFVPYEYFFKTRSSISAYIEIAAELVATGHNQLNKDSVCIFTSSSGTTAETVAAADYCRERGATTVCISGRDDVPFAKNASYAIINKMDDFSGSDADYLTLYMLTFSFIHRNGEFADYEDFCRNLANMPAALVDVKRQCDKKAEEFALAYKDEPYHMLTGCGTLWGETYSFGMCVLEEMQWIKTKTVKCAEFFHGALELIDDKVSLIVLEGEDECREMSKRVERFAKRYTKKLTVFDTADYIIPNVDGKYRPLLSPIIMTAVLDRVSIQLENKTGHSLDIRRYYKCVEY